MDLSLPPLRLTQDEKEALMDAALRTVLAHGPSNQRVLVRALHKLQDNTGSIRSEW